MATVLRNLPTEVRSHTQPKMPRRHRVRVGLAIAIVGGLLWHASLRTPTGPAHGTALNGSVTEPAPVSGPLRVATFNIHGARGLDGKRDLDRIAKCLEGFDVIGLQEIHGVQDSMLRDQADMLGEKLGMAWLFAPSVRQWHYYDFGNGILSRSPVIDWQRIPLARQTGKTYHNVLLARVLHHGRPIQVLITHVHRKDEQERQAQLRAVIALFQSLDEPAILMGDLNSNAADPQMAELLATPGVVDTSAGVSSPEGAARIDWILTRGLKTREAGIEHTGASDHPLVWAELEIAAP